MTEHAHVIVDVHKIRVMAILKVCISKGATEIWQLTLCIEMLLIICCGGTLSQG